MKIVLLLAAVSVVYFAIQLILASLGLADIKANRPVPDPWYTL